MPFSVHVDPQLFEQEQERIFHGRTWNYLGLEAEVPNPGDFVSTYVGLTPVVLNRGKDGSCTPSSTVAPTAARPSCARSAATPRPIPASITSGATTMPGDLRRHSVPARHQRQRRLSAGLQARGALPEDAARRVLPRRGVRHLRQGHGIGRRLHGRAGAQALRRAVQPPDQGGGLPAPADPRQLEALRREPEGLLPRRAAARLQLEVRHVPHLAARLDPDGAERHALRADRPTARRTRRWAAPTPRSAPTRPRSSSRRRKSWSTSRSTPTAWSRRCFPCSRPSSSPDRRTTSASATCIPKSVHEFELVWINFVYADDSDHLHRRHRAGQPARAERLPVEWRTPRRSS